MTPLKRKLFVGTFNRYRFFQDENRRIIVNRKPIENKILWEQIRKEYEGIGFFQLGGHIRLRSAFEQGKLCREWVRQGLPVLAPVKFSKTQGWYLFISGTSYDKWLTMGGVSDCIINAYIDSIIEAHRKKIVYGDRWGPNTMVTNENKIIHFDFDISLEGIPAKEFELAQTLYYTLSFSSKKEVINRFLIRKLRSIRKTGQYNWKTLLRLIKGHYRFFRLTKYACNKSFI